MNGSINHILVAKIAAFMIMLVYAFSVMSVSVLADPPTSITNPSKETFIVGDYLKIKDGQTYLDKGTQKEAVVVNFIIKFIKLLTTVIGSFALLFIIIGGFTLMISHGSSEMQRKGKTMIMYAVLGLVVAFLSLIIVTFVQSLFYQD